MATDTDRAPEPVYLGPMGLGELLDTAYRVYRRSFLKIFALAAVPVLAAFIIVTAVQSLGGINLTPPPVQPRTPPEDVLEMYAQFLTAKFVGFWLLTVVITTVSAALARGAVTAAAVAETRGRYISFGDAMRQGLRRLARLICADLLILLVLLLIVSLITLPLTVLVAVVIGTMNAPEFVIIGGVLLMIPLFLLAVLFGLLFVLRYQLYTPVMFAEDKGAFRSLMRSKHLMVNLSERRLFSTRNHIVRMGLLLLVVLALSLAIFLFMSLLMAAVSFAVAVVRVGMGAGLPALMSEMEAVTGRGPLPIVFNIVSRLTTAAVSGFEAVAFVIFYYEVCARCEGEDLHRSIDTLEALPSDAEAEPAEPETAQSQQPREEPASSEPEEHTEESEPGGG